MPPEPTSHSVQVNGLNLHYVDYGNAEATPLLLLHGLSNSSVGWRRVAEHFRDDYHVIALDQRGHGQSDHSPGRRYATDDYVADLEGVVEALGLGPFVLIGHSMGGHNAIAYTARHADQVLCSVANDIPPALNRDRDEIAARYPDGQHTVHPTVEAYINAGRADAPFTPEEMLLLNADAKLKPVDGGFQEQFDPYASIDWAPADLWEEAREITRPILFVRGGQSQVLDATVLQEMDMAIEPARSITLEKSGHNTFYDMEPEWLDIVGAFLQAHAAAPATEANA